MGIAREYLDAYAEYFDSRYEQNRFQEDAENFTLRQNPITFSDLSFLVLEVTPTTYSQVQFYQEKVATDRTKRAQLMSDFVKKRLLADFHQSITMHMTVLTRDDKLLLTKRSPKSVHYPEAWSASIEEQLKREDFADGPRKVIERWASRHLLEELGIDGRFYHVDNIRLLSVLLEANLLNTGVCVNVQLEVDSASLDTILQGTPRKDWEFTEWGFLDVDARTLLAELFRPRRVYHQTSPYRLLYTVLKRFGSPSDSLLLDVLQRD